MEQEIDATCATVVIVYITVIFVYIRHHSMFKVKNYFLLTSRYRIDFS